MALSKLLYEKVNPEDTEDALGYGARCLGYSELKVEQKNKRPCWERRYVLVTLPIGYGKSVVYQALPFCASRLREHSFISCSHNCSPIVIVVSPLIALMQDEVTNLKARGVKAVHIRKDTRGCMNMMT